jgi:nitrite reductase/ring-hydroxylating ferredoxin subunit
LITGVTILSCDKEEEGDIPDVPVDIYINVNKPSYSDLQTTGGWVYLTGGSKGIIVYRRSSREFMAYDRHCTYRPNKNCGRAQVDSSNIKIHCRPCSGSEYSIMDGSVLKGPASRPLKQYGTRFDGDVLHIYN